jgi:pSer/pThr/pTyr-binding forkhead associated (FHA) protein
MTKVLSLRRPNSRQRFNLTRNNQLGRGDFEPHIWVVQERPIPNVFRDLEARIDIDPDALEGSKISRNHAGIVQEGDNFYLYDLASLNGTSLNGTSVLASRPVELKEGDTINLADEVILQIKIHDASNYALLVGAGSDNIGASEGDVRRLKRLLQERRYVVRTLTGRNATKARLKEEFARMADEVVAESGFLFSFHGHGSTSGLSIGGQVFNPSDLYKRLGRIRSEQKAAILEACHCGVFVNEHNLPKIQPGTAVLTATGEYTQAAETMLVGHSRPSERPTRYTGRLAKALEHYLTVNPGEVSLSNFYTTIRENVDGRYTNLLTQSPQFHKAHYTVHRISTLLRSEII